ncbi:MAG: ComEC family competence protein [Alphaproteobacteria bacterium]|nr:ComEC family competence protein [Alphaproteobacteria bacterium]
MNKFISVQYPNFLLWMPFIFGAGAITYFAWPTEPVVAIPWIISALFAACAFAVYHSWRRGKINITYYVSLVTLLIFGFGFFWSVATTHALDTKTIRRDGWDISISGVVENISYTATRVRVFIKDDDGMVMRLSLTKEEAIPKIGSRIETIAMLYKPQPASVPGAFDMAEHAYFKGFGATGYPKAPLTVVDDAPTNRFMIANLRDTIHNRIATHGNDTGTALVDSLVLGHGRTMDGPNYDAARAAGIAHIFSISGFHMTLIGGWLFVFFYLIFRATTPLTRNIPARIPALICTWMALLFYLSISGAMVATQRAFMMATLGFIAVAFGRTIISLRNVCLVFGLILLFNPHYIVEIGFQLSFGAIFAIFYFLSADKYQPLTRREKIKRTIKGAILATLAATLFTEPLIMYHFNSVQIYTLAGNLFIVPLFSILIMPLVILGTIFGAVIGWFLPLDLAAYSYDAIMWLTGQIASWPYAVTNVPRIPGISMILFAIAALIMMFVIGYRRQKIYICSALVVAGLLIYVTRPKPIFYSVPGGELVAFMTDGGTLQFNKARASNHRIAFESWDALNGDLDRGRIRKTIGAGFDGEKYSVRCIDKVCYYTTPKWRLAYAQQFVPLYRHLARICAEDIFVVSYFRFIAPDCRATALRGGFVIYPSGRVEYARGGRIWHR